MGEDTREVRNEVEEARARLGDTVEALAYKVNAPRRFRDTVTAKVERVKQRVGSDPRAAKVRDGVDSVKDSVESTKDAVEASVKAGVESAKETMEEHRNGDRAAEEQHVARR
jgi:hypothetical protein